MSQQTSSQTFLAYWLGYETEGNTLEQTPPNVGTVALAFALTAKGSTLSMHFLESGGTSVEDIQKSARFLQARGQKVVMSINGDKKYFKHGWKGLDPEIFASNVKKIVIDEWGLDGIDLDNEDPMYSPCAKPDGNFVQVIKALRKEVGPDKTISLPVFMDMPRDAYLTYVKDDIDYVFTMAYWNPYDGQISLLKTYQGIVGNEKAGIGVAEAAPEGQNTDFEIVPKLSRYKPKAGMMLWSLNSCKAGKWSKAIADNLAD